MNDSNWIKRYSKTRDGFQDTLEYFKFGVNKFFSFENKNIYRYIYIVFLI